MGIDKVHTGVDVVRVCREGLFQRLDRLPGLLAQNMGPPKKVQCVGVVRVLPEHVLQFLDGVLGVAQFQVRRHQAEARLNVRGIKLNRLAIADEGVIVHVLVGIRFRQRDLGLRGFRGTPGFPPRLGEGVVRLVTAPGDGNCKGDDQQPPQCSDSGRQILARVMHLASPVAQSPGSDRPRGVPIPRSGTPRGRPQS